MSFVQKHWIIKYLFISAALGVALVAAAAMYVGGLHNLYDALLQRFSIGENMGQPVETDGVPVLMYHHLAPAGTYTGTSNENNGSIMSVEQFTEQMDYLAEEGYSTIFSSELIELLKNKEELPEKTVVITFDDAYESVYVYAFPILQKYGFKADVSIIGVSINRRGSGEYNPKVLTTLSPEQVTEMQESGLVEFHSHTYDLHKILPINNSGETGYAATSQIYLTELERRETAAEKKQRLHNDFQTQKELLAEYGVSTNILFYPYGVTNNALIDIAKEYGIEAAFTVTSGIVTQDSNLFRLPRVTASPFDSMEDFIHKLKYTE